METRLRINRFMLLGALPFLLPFSSLAQRTDLQKILTPNSISQAELIKKHGLVRLWPLNSINTQDSNLNIEDSVTSRFLGPGNHKVKSRAVGVSAKMCANQVYAKFNMGAIVSDETEVIDDLLTGGAYNWYQTFDDYMRKKAVAGSTRLGVGSSELNPFTQLHSNRLVDEIKKPEVQQAVYYTTSLVSINKDKKYDRLQVDSSNYSIGGWFKPNAQTKGVSLFKKYFTNSDTGKQIVEWEIFYSGNLIYFHHYRDVEVSAESKFLTSEEARVFRARNAHFYDANDYYSQVAEKKEIQDSFSASQAIGALPKKLIKIFVDMPINHKNAKPIPEPPEQPPINPPVVINPIPIIPLPPGEIPMAPFPAKPFMLGYASSGKDHTLSFDIKAFWWGSATTIGACYGCIAAGIDHDVWHFFAVSVHLDDRLGPYIDLYIIRDPNEKRFGTAATLSSHFRTQRIELNRDDFSRPLRNPITHSFMTEKDCRGSHYCTRSELEMGSLDNNRPYSGYMRGLFISKKALNQNSLLELAAEFNPMDTNLCTYNKL